MSQDQHSSSVLVSSNQGETKVCSACQSKISEKASICPHCRNKCKKGKFNGVGALVFFGTIFFLFIIFSGLNTSTTSQSKTTKQSSAFMLAALEVQDNNPPSSLVNSFDVILETLSSKCPGESKEIISDYIYTAKKTLTEEGKMYTLMEIATAMKDALSGEPSGITCKETAALFATFLK